MRAIYALHKAISALHMPCITCAGFYMTCQIVQLHNKCTHCFYLNLCSCAILHERASVPPTGAPGPPSDLALGKGLPKCGTNAT